MRSNEMLLKAVNTYKEVAELPDAPHDLVKATLKRRADRQQFLGTQTHSSSVSVNYVVSLCVWGVIYVSEQVAQEDLSLLWRS